MEYPKQGIKKINDDQSILKEESILLSEPYSDDVTFIKPSNDQIITNGLRENHHHILHLYKFAHTLISSCLEETDRIHRSSSIRGLIHLIIRCVEKRSIFSSAILCLLLIDKHCSYLRSLNIDDSDFMLIRKKKLILRSYPQYHRGSSFSATQLFTSNSITRLYHDKYIQFYILI